MIRISTQTMPIAEEIKSPYNRKNFEASKELYDKGLRRCCKCREVKPFSEFHKNSALWHGCSAACKECYTIQGKDRAPKNREKRRELKYGVSPWLYWGMMLEQHCKCAICGATMIHDGTKGEQPHIDHDHGTGAVRGLICTRCNTGIGMLGDSAERARSAAMYLESYATD